MSLKNLLNEVKSPSIEFRGVPFWAWNGTIDEEEIRTQIRDFKKMGLGGFFMHSRVGLNTEYLGEKWFKCILAGIDEAKKQGLKAWLYDEDRWPSGAAGGLVTQNHKFRARQLKIFYGEIPNGTEYEAVLGRFVRKKIAYSVNCRKMKIQIATRSY